MIMVMNDLLPPPLCNVNRPSHSEIQLFQNLTMKIHGQDHVCGQRSRSCLTFKIQWSRSWPRSNPSVSLGAWNSIDMFAFCFVAIGQKTIFWLRYSKFYIWPWKFKVKVMAKVKPDGHIWALDFNLYGCFLFHVNRTIVGWDIANSIFDLEKSRSRSRRKSTKIKSGNLQVKANNRAKNERNPKGCSKVIAWTRICGRRRRQRRTNRYKNIKSPPVYRGDLMMVSLLMHICVTWPQWVKCCHHQLNFHHNSDKTPRSLSHRVSFVVFFVTIKCILTIWVWH